jgi:hypothetical protein
MFSRRFRSHGEAMRGRSVRLRSSTRGGHEWNGLNGIVRRRWEGVGEGIGWLWDFYS